MLSVTQLRDAAEIPLRALPDETRIGLPTPVGPSGKAHIGFLCYPETLSPKKKLEFLAPNYLILLSPDDGHLIQMKAIQPSDFGQPHQPDDVIGGWGVDRLSNTPEEITRMWNDLIAALDELLPVYVENRRVTDNVRQAAKNYLYLFDIISEEAFRPYYRALGHDFYAWLERISK